MVHQIRARGVRLREPRRPPTLRATGKPEGYPHHRTDRVPRTTDRHPTRTCMAKKILGSQGEYADAMSIYRDKYLNPRRAALAAALQTHIDNGTIRNDVDAETLIRVISNTMLGGIITPDEPATTTSPELIVDLFLNGLL
ncbi:TetR/AcrR family transcriptional regulator C-terminal ligand-binding domain-containing protein [Gordonia humi]